MNSVEKTGTLAKDVAASVMSAPVISVLMPTYNYGDFIAQAIESVLAQTFTHFELIISDNASTDATEQLVRRYAARDTRVRYFRNQTNLGLSKNFNLSHSRAHPESRYLIGLPADDWWDERLLEKLYNAARRHPEASLVHCDALRVEADGAVINRFTDLCHLLPAPGLHRDLDKLFYNNYIPFQACLVDRQLQRHLWATPAIYDPEVPHANDWYLWLQLLCRGARAYYLPEPLARFRKHPRANTTVEKLVPRLSQEVLVFEKTAAVCPPEHQNTHRSEYANRLKRLGFLLLESSHVTEAKRALAKADEAATHPQLDLTVARLISRLPLPGKLRAGLWNTATAVAARKQPS